VNRLPRRQSNKHDFYRGNEHYRCGRQLGKRIKIYCRIDKLCVVVADDKTTRFSNATKSRRLHCDFHDCSCFCTIPIVPFDNNHAEHPIAKVGIIAILRAFHVFVGRQNASLVATNGSGKMSRPIPKRLSIPFVIVFTHLQT
jgi:hypothetical protein